MQASFFMQEIVLSGMLASKAARVQGDRSARWQVSKHPSRHVRLLAGRQLCHQAKMQTYLQEFPLASNRCSALRSIA
jgi:hypothetical protein